jgi:hypothetical protein
MTPLLNHENIGAVQKIAYLTATITSVDSANDTACFEGVGTCPSGVDVIIFYHCEADSVLRDNGALEGAAGAFSVDDEVIVQCEITGANQYVPLRVMGFTDKPKKCGFGFKLTRDDETLITEDSGLLTYIRLYNSDNVSVSITELVYTPVPEIGEDVDGYWSFNLTDSADADENGYWVDYHCQYGLPTQHPYLYKAADKRKVEDLIKLGPYEDNLPFWRAHNATNTGIYFTPPPDLPDVWWPLSACSVGWINSPVVEANVVESSVPYRVTFTAYGSPHVAYYGNYKTDCSSNYCSWCQANAWEHWYCKERPETVIVTSSNGDTSNNLETNPISSTKYMYPPAHIMQVNTHEMGFTYTGGDYDLMVSCYAEDDTPTQTTFSLPFKFFWAYGEMTAYVLT